MNIKLFKQSLSTQVDLKINNWKTELHMEAFLIDNCEILKISDSSVVTVITTQIHLDKGRISIDRNGRLDMLIAIEDENIDENYLAIVELKRGTLEKEHLDQLNDYLNSFHSLRDGLLTGQNEKYKNYILKGILVGTNINNEVKTHLLSDRLETDTNFDIIGITLNRFLSIVTNESFVISEIYSNKESSYKRFDGIDEYLSNLDLKIKPSFVIKNILSKIVNKYTDDEGITINYTSRDISISSRISQKSNKSLVFAYLIPLKDSVKVYIKLANKIDVEGLEVQAQEKKNVIKENSFYFKLSNIAFLEVAFILIEASKEFIRNK